jgi:hypothetical protein
VKIKLRLLLTFSVVFINSASSFGESLNRISHLAEVCLQQQTKDEICSTLVNMKQIGDDSVEAIKQYADLGPTEYYALTLLNVIISKRLRIKNQLEKYPNITQTLDIKDESILISFRTTF